MSFLSALQVNSLPEHRPEYADPYKDQQAPLVTEAPNPFANSRFGKFMAKGRYPIEQRIEDKKRGIGRQKHPFVGASGHDSSNMILAHS